MAGVGEESGVGEREKVKRNVPLIGGREREVQERNGRLICQVSPFMLDESTH
jgi:hypothetical protein